MKTILLAIETSGPGGAEKVVLSLANSLAVDGHRVMILLLKDGWLAEQLRAGKHEVLIVPLRRTLPKNVRTPRSYPENPILPPALESEPLKVSESTVPNNEPLDWSELLSPDADP